MKYSLLIATAFTILFTVVQPSNAAEISKVKGSQLLINNEGEVFSEGQTLISKDGEVEIKIKKVKPDKSLAEVIRGNPTPGMKLKVKNSIEENEPPEENLTSSRKTEQKKQKPKQSEKQRKGLKFILFVGTSSQNMSVKTSDGSKYNLKGNNSFFELALAYSGFHPQLELVGLLGSIPFKTSGTTDGVSNSTEITYTKVGGIIRYSFLTGDTKLWLGLSGNYFSAASKKSTVLDENKIGSQQSVGLSVGGDFSLGRGMSIPLIGEYAMFPQSASVSAQETRIFSGFSYQLE